MAYNNMTVKEVEEILRAGFEEEFSGAKFLPKSFIGILIKIISTTFIIPFKMCGWFYLQLFPDTAEFGEVEILGRVFSPLVRLGNQFGEGEPLQGTAWEGGVTLTVNEEGLLQDGTQLRNPATGILYLTQDNIRVFPPEANVNVKCVQVGAAGDVAVGSELQFVSPLGFVARGANVYITTTEGSDGESEASYRQRVVSRYNRQPQGGALIDYRRWGAEAAGVSQIYPYNYEGMAGGVLIYVAADINDYPRRVPDDALLKAVAEKIIYDPSTGEATRKPVTAIIDPRNDGSYENVKAITPVTFDVYVTGVAEEAVLDFGVAFKTAAENFMLGREPFIRGLSDDNNKKDLVSRNALISEAYITSSARKITFGELEIKKDGETVAEYVLTGGELAELGGLYINGEVYEG